MGYTPPRLPPRIIHPSGTVWDYDAPITYTTGTVWDYGAGVRIGQRVELPTNKICAYCGNTCVADKRGACASCGAPNILKEAE